MSPIETVTVYSARMGRDVVVNKDDAAAFLAADAARVAALDAGDVVDVVAGDPPEGAVILDGVEITGDGADAVMDAVEQAAATPGTPVPVKRGPGRPVKAKGK